MSDTIGLDDAEALATWCVFWSDMPDGSAQGALAAKVLRMQVAEIARLREENVALLAKVAALRWRPPSKPPGAPCVALDENGEECCAFQDPRTGKWYQCSNVVGPDYEFQPQAWTPLPTR